MTAGRVNQIRFGFDERLGKLGVVASSFNNNEMTRFWHSELSTFYRMGTVDSAQPPETAFTHLKFPEGRAVLLYRHTEPGDAARNLSHALIADEFDLEDLALPLTRWRGWRDELYSNGWLPALPLEAFGVSGESLDHAARRDDLEASGLLAALLRHPEDRFSVQGMPDEHVVPSLWAVRQIMSVIAEALPWSREWTFSTYETSDASRPRLPALLFLPEGATGAADNGRVRIRHGRRSDEHGTLADALLSRYRGGDLDELLAEVRGVVQGRHDIYTRIDRLVEKWGYVPRSGDLGWTADDTVVAQPVVEQETASAEQVAAHEALIDAMNGLAGHVELLTHQVDRLVRAIEQSSLQSSQQRPSSPPPAVVPSHVEPVQFSPPRQPEMQLRQPPPETGKRPGLWTEVGTVLGFPVLWVVIGLTAFILLVVLVRAIA